MRKRILPAVGPALSGSGLQPCPAQHFLLHLHENVTGDNGLVASFDVILWNDALVNDTLLVQEIRRNGFLQKRVTDVFFVGQDFLERAGQPVIAACRRPDAVCGKLLSDLVVAFAAEVFPVDELGIQSIST